MSANDGGPAIRVSRAPVDRPRIPRGIVSVPVCPSERKNRPVAGECADFSLRVIDDAGRAYEARYHGARAFSVEDEDRALFEVGPEVVVTWKEI